MGYARSGVPVLLLQQRSLLLVRYLCRLTNDRRQSSRQILHYMNSTPEIRPEPGERKRGPESGRGVIDNPRWRRDLLLLVLASSVEIIKKEKNNIYLAREERRNEKKAGPQSCALHNSTCLSRNYYVSWHLPGERAKNKSENFRSLPTRNLSP